MSPLSPSISLSCLFLPIPFVIVPLGRCSGRLLTKTVFRHSNHSLLCFPLLGDKDRRSPTALGPVYPFNTLLGKRVAHIPFPGTQRQLLESGFPWRVLCREGHAHACTACPTSLQVRPTERREKGLCSRRVRGQIPALLNPKPYPIVSSQVIPQPLRGCLLPTQATWWPSAVWICCPRSGWMWMSRTPVVWRR